MPSRREPVFRRRHHLRCPGGALEGEGKKSRARNDDNITTHFRIPAAHRARVMPAFSPIEGVGNAGCSRTRSRACSVGSTRVSHHGYAETPGIPARNGFNGFLRALPGDRALLSPSSLRSLLLKNLNASVEASGPHDFAVRVSAIRQRRIRVHRIPPRVRDDRDTPLLWDETAKSIQLIWVR
jgi:hypothetical protein